MTDTYHTDIRLQLLANAYSILPNVDKKCMRLGWADADYAKQELTDNAKRTAVQRIKNWPKIYQECKATGVRIENGLVPLDVDVNDEAGATAMYDAIEAIAPEVGARAPTRFGEGYKFALFCRAAPDDAAFGLIHSRAYYRPGESEENGDDDHKVEIFGGKKTYKGKCSRQFGIYGPHSHNDDGTVKRYYTWDDERPALHTVKLTDLPVLTVAMAYAIVAAFEAWAEANGWTRSEQPDTDSGGAVYDIDENTRFDTNRGGHGLTYDELCDAYAVHGEGLRVSSSFMAGRSGVKTERCWVNDKNKYACVAVWVYGDDQNHYPKELDPGLRAEALRENLKQLEATPAAITSPPRPDDKASLFDKAKWLLETHAYCAPTDTVVELHKPSDACQMKVIGFQRLFMAWYEEEIGPRKGITRNYASSIWLLQPTRINVGGVRLRPDQPFPVYQEGGEAFKNTYLQPHHAGSGDIAPWLAFMEHLLPDPVERDWFCSWLAHKHRFPGVPGVAVVMVAVDANGPVYGAGRSMLRDIIARLLGPRYVKPIDFDVFTGRSAQGVYTDWAAYSVLVTVNEAKDTPGSGQWAERRAVYERLKELVDPRAIERTFTAKGRPAFSAQAFASYLIFSNNRDALQIPPDDRRVTALRNGIRLPPAQAAALQQWMDDPGNIAELARWLEVRDLTGFDVYTPLHTQTKATMQELARSDIDEALDAVRKTIGPRGLFTGKILRNALLTELNDWSDPVVRNVKRLARSVATKITIGARMPDEGRDWILTWHGHDTAYVTDTVAAQAAVAHTEARLKDLKNVEDRPEVPLSSMSRTASSTSKVRGQRNV